MIAQVERRLDGSLARPGAWAESAGYRSDRGTWVRVDSRARSVIHPQSWVGAEAASVIPGVPWPAWFQSATWVDTSRERVWRAEVACRPNGAGELPDLGVSGRQELIIRRISQVLGGAVDTTVTQWTTSHGALHWGNTTAPALSLLDWADWRLAPRGNDAACLWASALAVPDIADRVHAEFCADLDCRSEKIAQLLVCGNILRMADQRADAHDLAEPARVAADQLVTDLR